MQLLPSSDQKATQHHGTKWNAFAGDRTNTYHNTTTTLLLLIFSFLNHFNIHEPLFTRVSPFLFLHLIALRLSPLPFRCSTTSCQNCQKRLSPNIPKRFHFASSTSMASLYFPLHSSFTAYSFSPLSRLLPLGKTMLTAFIQIVPNFKNQTLNSLFLSLQWLSSWSPSLELLSYLAWQYLSRSVFEKVFIQFSTFLCYRSDLFYVLRLISSKKEL